MDRISHNECLVICAVLHSLVCNIMDMARLDLIIVLSVDDAIRKRVHRYDSYREFINGESRFEQALNRKFQEFQPIIINAMTMMQMTGVIENGEGNMVDMTLKGKQIAEETHNIPSPVTEEVKRAVIQLNELINGIDTIALYKDLKIVL